MKPPVRSRQRAWRAGLFVLAAGLAAMGLYRSGWSIPERPAREFYRAYRRLRNITTSSKLHLLITFDEDRPVEWVSNTALLQSGVARVPGRFGYARRFDGHQRTFVASQADWNSIGDRFTISIWMQLEDRSPYQHVLYADAHGPAIGLHLEDGAMTLSLPDHPAVISYPFDRYGEFVHMAAVVDGPNRVAVLYENGSEMGRAAIASVGTADHNIVFSMSRWYRINKPVHGTLDETIVWRRALSPSAIDRLAKRSRGMLPRLMPVAYAWDRTSRVLRNGFRSSLALLDAFNVFLHPGYAQSGGLPEFHLYLSNADLRHLMAGHARSAATGMRDREAATARNIRYGFDGHVAPGTLRLHQSGHDYGHPERRAAFIMTTEDSRQVFGTSRILLRPPEDAGLIEPLMASSMARTLGLPHTAGNLCRLFVNGQFRGVYLVEDHAQMGLLPGTGTGAFAGPTHPGNWHALFIHGTDPPPPSAYGECLSRQERLALYDALLARYRRILLNDPFIPHGSLELHRRLNQGRRTFAWPDRGAPCATAVADNVSGYHLLGRNPAPFFIVTDLNTDIFRIPGVTIRWHSDNPAVIGHDGTVNRPIGHPVEVTFSATITAAGQTVEKPLRFRVMPDPLTMPALMITAADQIMQKKRTDAQVCLHPAGSDGTSPLRFTALQAGGGGIAHRGNTGVWQPKKPFSLRLDEPHYLLDETATRHLYLTTGYADPTFMRNRLVYDLFRSFSTPDAPRYAPHVKWAEVFVNGAYHGLYEIGTRIQRRKLGFPAYREGDRDHGEIYKVLDVIEGLQEPGPATVVQKYPAPRHGYHRDSYETFLETLQYWGTDDRFDHFASIFDVDNAVDFQLLLDLTEGSDNMNVNFYLVRNPGPDRRYYFVAWDKKRCFKGTTRPYPHHFLRNTVLPTPDFQRLVRARWAELRDGPAALAGLLQAIDAMERHLCAYVPWEFERWGLNNGYDYADLVAHLRGLVARRHTWMDAWLRDEGEADPH